MRTAVIYISFEKLAQELKLGQNASIVRVYQPDHSNETVCIQVRKSSIPYDIYPGDVLPCVPIEEIRSYR